MMRNLELERIVLAAMSLGIAKRCIEVMGAYSRERSAFGRPIAEFGQVIVYFNSLHFYFDAYLCMSRICLMIFVD
jgi:Acyl-CoA dehydrogenase, C-terminal domain